MADLAVCIVNYKTPDLTLRCLAALAEERALLPALKAVVADACSGDGSAEILAAALAHPDYLGWAEFLPLPLNGGFGWANNQIMLRLLQSENPPEFIHLLNPDTVIERGAVLSLVEAMKADPRCAAAGSQLIDGAGRPAGSAFRFPTAARELIRGSNTPALGRLLGIEPVLVDPGRACEVDWVTGASVMLRSGALRHVGLFDSGFFLYFEEIELMHRLRKAGWSVRHVPGSRVYHVGGASTGINGHDPEQVKRRPPYWYRSRRRFFALSQGRFAAVAADLGWLAGHSLWRIRRALSRVHGKIEVPFERSDLLTHGPWPGADDLSPEASQWDSPVGEPPAWGRETEAG